MIKIEDFERQKYEYCKKTANDDLSFVRWVSQPHQRVQCAYHEFTLGELASEYVKKFYEDLIS